MDEKLLRHKRLAQEASDYWGRQYEQMGLDLAFATGDQWSDKERKDRVNRPTLTINRVKSFVNRVVNSVRLNPFAINITTVGASADVEEVINGAVRAIEHNSDAQEAYINALEHSTICGLGWLVVDHDYEDDDSLNQVITVSSPQDPRSILIDPSAENAYNARYAIRFTRMDQEEAERTYGQRVDKGMFESVKLFCTPENSVPEVWFYELVRKEQLKYWFADGTSSFEESEGWTNKRKVFRKFVEVTHYVGSIEVESTVIDISCLPIIPVFGSKVYEDNLRFGGMVRDLRDIQISTNYIASTETELIASAPKNPWVVADSQIAGFEKIWDQAATKPPLYLPYKATPNAPKPERENNTAQTQSLQSAYMLRAQDFNSVTGIFDSSMGDGSGVESGVAISVKAFQGETATATYIQKLSSAIRQAGRVIVEMLPLIYDTDRQIDVLDKGRMSAVVSNFCWLSNIFTGVEVNAGPAFASKKSASINALQFITATLPEDKRTALLDIIVENTDIPNKSKVIERMEALLPSEFKEGGIPADALEAIQVADQTIEQLKTQLGQANAIINNLQIYLLSNEKQIEADVSKAVIKSETDMQIAILKEEGANSRKLAELENRLSQLLAKFDHEESQKVLGARIDAIQQDSEVELDAIKANLPRNVVPKGV